MSNLGDRARRIEAENTAATNSVPQRLSAHLTALKLHLDVLAPDFAEQAKARKIRRIVQSTF